DGPDGQHGAEGAGASQGGYRGRAWVASASHEDATCDSLPRDSLLLGTFPGSSISGWHGVCGRSSRSGGRAIHGSAIPISDCMESVVWSAYWTCVRRGFPGASSRESTPTWTSGVREIRLRRSLSGRRVSVFGREPPSTR